jgi:hypothetical protein
MAVEAAATMDFGYLDIRSGTSQGPLDRAELNGERR